MEFLTCFDGPYLAQDELADYEASSFLLVIHYYFHVSETSLTSASLSSFSFVQSKMALFDS